MKLRQKLAAVLAATMVVTAVPVVTMAASTNKVTKVLTITKNGKFHEKTTASMLKLESEDAQANEIFFLELENAEWKDGADTVLDTAAGVVGAVVTVTSKTEATVKITNPADIQIPMLVKATGGEAAVSVVAEDSAMTSGKYVFARTADTNETVSVKVGSAKTFYTEGGIADITIEELVTGAIAAADADDREITITLDNADFEFDYSTAATGTEIEVKYGKGLAGKTAKATVKVNKNDKQTLVVELPNVASTAARGTITLEGLKVVSTVKAPTTGELKVDIEGELISNVSDAKVATVAEYGSTLKIKDDKALEIVAGKAKDATITLKEVIQDSIVNGRSVEFKLENGYFEGEVETKDDEDTFKGTIKVNGTAVSAADVIIEKVDGVKRAVGFELTLADKANALDEYKIEAGIQTVVGAAGDVVLTAEGRAIGEELTLVVATVAPDFKVETTPAKLEAGLKGQEAGQIVITEEKAGALARGEVVTITLADEDGITFTGKPEVEATGDMKLTTEEVKEDGQITAITLKVERASKEAATITVKNFPVTVNKSIADGGYDAKVEVSNRDGKVKAEDFFVIGEGIASKVTTTITNGATEMVVNGAKVALDAPAFLENGKMMVPLRAVAEAFGINSKDIVYNAGEIVIFANGRTIALTIGSTDAYVNGAKMTLANPAKIVNERTTVPVGDMARLLGVKVEWDNTTKTATFNN